MSKYVIEIMVLASVGFIVVHKSHVVKIICVLFCICLWRCFQYLLHFEARTLIPIISTEETKSGSDTWTSIIFFCIL